MRTIRLVALLGLASVSSLSAQEFRLGTLGYLAQRTTTFNGVLGTGDATMLGVELSGRYKFVGAMIRTWGGSFSADSDLSGAGKIATGELRLMGGPRVFNANVGYGRRALNGALAERTWTFVRLGATSEFDIGGSDFSAQLSAGYYTGVGGSGTFDKGSGSDVESRLLYQFRRLPVYLTLGYRRERFVVEEDDNERPEVVSSVLFGGGIRLGRRAR